MNDQMRTAIMLGIDYGMCLSWHSTFRMYIVYLVESCQWILPSCRFIRVIYQQHPYDEFFFEGLVLMRYHLTPWYYCIFLFQLIYQRNLPLFLFCVEEWGWVIGKQTVDNSNRHKKVTTHRKTSSTNLEIPFLFECLKRIK